MEIHLVGGDGGNFKEIEKEVMSTLKGFQGFMEFREKFSKETEQRLKAVSEINIRGSVNLQSSDVKILGENNDPIINAVGVFICANRMCRELAVYLEKTKGYPTDKALTAAQVIVEVAKTLEHSMLEIADKKEVPKVNSKQSYLPQMPKKSKPKPKKETEDE